MEPLYRDKEWLYQKYVVEKLSSLQIADLLGCHRTTVVKWLKRHDIPRKRKATVYCENCGAELERGFSRIKRAERQFCNRRCKGQWMKTNYRGGSNPHYKKRVEVECAYCGGKKKILPCRAEREQDNFFCDYACMGAWQSEHLSGKRSYAWKGGRVKYYGPNWQRQRRKARQRDNFRCQVCGIQENELNRELDVHHIVPFLEFGYVVGENAAYRKANRLTNLLSLCPTCHRQVEAGLVSVQTKMF